MIKKKPSDVSVGGLLGFLSQGSCQGELQMHILLFKCHFQGQVRVYRFCPVLLEHFFFVLTPVHWRTPFICIRFYAFTHLLWIFWSFRCSRRFSRRTSMSSGSRLPWSSAWETPWLHPVARFSAVSMSGSFHGAMCFRHQLSYMISP